MRYKRNCALLTSVAVLAGTNVSRADDSTIRASLAETRNQITRIIPADGPRYARSFRAPDGAFMCWDP